jgi:hypothetical protein
MLWSAVALLEHLEVLCQNVTAFARDKSVPQVSAAAESRGLQVQEQINVLRRMLAMTQPVMLDTLALGFDS